MKRGMGVLGRGLLAGALFLAAGPARPSDPHFERIGPSRGLLAGEITAVIQDRVGLLWLGTREGLLLFDGYQFRVFERDPDREGSLADNWVRSIHEDRDGRLWIGTNGGGLDLLDRATWTFVHHRHSPEVSSSIPDNGVFAILQDRHGALWVGTRKGLARMGPSGDSFERLPPDAWVIDLFEDASGGLWIATFGEGIFLREEAGTLREIPVSDPPAEWRPRRARCLAQDSHGTLWAGVAGGLLRFDPDAGSFRPVPIPIGPGGPPGLPTASDLAATPEGTLWVGTPGGGLIAMDPVAHSGVRYAFSPTDGSTLSSDNVQTIHLGRDGTLWIGTGEGTLNQLRADADLFTIRRTRPDQADFGFASAVIEDGGGRVWMGSFGAGVEIVDPATGEERASGLARSPDSGERAVTSMYPARKGGAWVGTPVGLARLDERGAAQVWWKHDPTAPASLGPGYVTAILETRDETVWVGTSGTGLFRMRGDRSGFDHLVVADGFVSSLVEAADGTIWVGTRSSGILALPSGSVEPRPYVRDSGDLAVLSRQSVTSLLEDTPGRLWIGTSGGGLFRVDLSDGGVLVRRFGEADGLVDQNVAGILEDDDGSIWVSTRRGLARLDPETAVFATWGLDDGLPSPVFNVGSAWRGSTSLHFGTKQGLVSIRRGTPFPNPTPSPVVLTSLRTLQGPVVADRPVWEVDAVTIRYGEVLFVDFGVLDFRGADRHRFGYRIEKNGGDWVDLGNRRSLTFTDLDPGEQFLLVRGRNANGVWSEAKAPIRITVIPPFWMTWWFQLAAIAVLVGAAWTGHRVRTTALEKRNRVLEALQREREKALEEAQASQRALHDAYERLRTLTRRLEAAKEDERRDIARELHDEMGQALSATKINLKALGRLPDGPARGERLSDTLSLVDGMIRHVRTLSLDLRPPLLEELGLVASLRTYAEGQALRTGVAIAVEANADALDVPADIAIAAFRVVQEGVNNVLRHAGARRITVSVRRDTDRLFLAIADDGTGFDVSEALGRASAGGHLGLLGMRERVEALGGAFEVLSSPGQGAEVRASVPLSSERGAS